MFKDKVLKALEKIRPNLQADGGDIELVDADEAKGLVKVSLRGACGCCPHAAVTLKDGVERMLKADVPEVKEVVAV